jgi:hypothetical protein
MTIHTGNLIITTDTTLPDLTAVDGHLTVRKGASLTANALTVVTWHLIVDEGATLTADALTAVYGNLDVRKGASLTANALTVVRRGLFVHKGATLTANALTTAYGQPGRELARCPVDGYVLWSGDNGLYYAGCCTGLTREQALGYWGTNRPVKLTHTHFEILG